MFNNLFNRWEVTIKDGAMIRTCRFTRKIQYRDSAQKKWVSLNRLEELDSVRVRRGESFSLNAVRVSITEE